MAKLAPARLAQLLSRGGVAAVADAAPIKWGDQIVAMEVLSEEKQEFEILTVTESGYGKRTPVTEYRAQGRGGKGIITMKTTDKNGDVVATCQVLPKDDVMLVSNKGQMIRIHIGEISEQGRNTQGVRLMTMAAGEKVVAVELIAEAVAVDDAKTPANGNGALPS